MKKKNLPRTCVSISNIMLRKQPPYFVRLVWFVVINLIMLTVFVGCPNPIVERILEPFNRGIEEEVAPPGDVTPQPLPMSQPLPPPTPVSNSKIITAFVFSSLPATGVINDAAKTISVTVANETDVTALTPTVAHTGVSYSPDGAQDFSVPVTYTVTAADGSTQDYIVTVIVAPPGTYIVTVTNGTTDNGVYFYVPGDTVTITADPAPAGHQFKEWTATGVTLTNPASETITFTMPSNEVTVTASYELIPTYGISLVGSGTALTSYTFPPEPTGYTTPPTLTVTVTNTGNQPTGDLAVALSGTNAANFTLSATSISSITVDGTATFSVSPNGSLTPNTYTATVTVSGGNSISANFDVSFEVVTAAVISTPADLANISNNLAGDYVLADNITVSNWEPIGNTDNPFTGTFDGNGKTITINSFDFDADVGTYDYRGFFSKTSGAQVFDLEVNLNIDQTITTTKYQWIGGISGFDDDSTFSRVAVTGDFELTIDTTARVALAGIVGAGRRMTFEDCYSDVNITVNTNGDLIRVGGIANINEAAGGTDVNTFRNCLYAGSIDVDTTRGSDYAEVGGILGETHSSVTNNIINCAVVSSSLIYRTSGSSGSIHRIVSDRLSGSATGTLNISGCIANGSMTITKNGTAVSITDDPDDIDGASKNATELRTQSTYTGWDFTNVWQMGTNWPVLRMP